MKQKKQQLGETAYNRILNEQQLRELIHKLQQKDASQRLDIARLREQIQEIQLKYHKALKQIGEMEKIQKRDYNYILKIDTFLAQAKQKFDGQRKQQSTEQYVDVLSEMTRQRDEYKKLYEQLDQQMQILDDENIKLKLMLQTQDRDKDTSITPQQSQQQFQVPLLSQIDEIPYFNRSRQEIKPSKKSSVYSTHTQDSFTNNDNSNYEEDQLKHFLQQLDEESATQLFSIFSQMGEDETYQYREKDKNEILLRKILSDSTEQSIDHLDSLHTNSLQNTFSFTQKLDNKENYPF